MMESCGHTFHAHCFDKMCGTVAAQRPARNLQDILRCPNCRATGLRAWRFHAHRDPHFMIQEAMSEVLGTAPTPPPSPPLYPPLC